jgi:hypothetical protein
MEAAAAREGIGGLDDPPAGLLDAALDLLRFSACLVPFWHDRIGI